jgi:hypothetical protein
MEDQDAVVSLNAAEGNMQKELDLVWKHLLPAFGDRPLPDDAALQRRLADKCAKLEISAPKGTGLALPALPAACSYGRSNLMPEGKGILEKSDSGWTLVGGNRRLAIGDGAWAETTWKFDDGNVEPLFALVGTRTAIAAGRWTNEKTLRVSWHLLDCTQKGEFEVKVQ